MSVVTIPKPLREKLGDDATEGLVQFINEATKDARDNVILLAEEKFEKRLTQEAFRLEKNNPKGCKIRADMASLKTELISFTSKLK